jgi:hypothetical protein
MNHWNKKYECPKNEGQESKTDPITGWVPVGKGKVNTERVKEGEYGLLIV